MVVFDEEWKIDTTDEHCRNEEDYIQTGLLKFWVYATDFTFEPSRTFLYCFKILSPYSFPLPLRWQAHLERIEIGLRHCYNTSVTSSAQDNVTDVI